MPDCFSKASRLTLDSRNIEAFGRSLPVVFRPIWNVEKKYLCGYIARVTNAGAVLACVEASARGPVQDIGLLAKAADALADLQARGEKSVVVVPVSFETLNLYPWRGHYLSLLRRIPEGVRSFIVLQLGNIPRGAPKQRLQTLQGDVRDLCRALAFTTDLRGQHLDSVLRQNVHACAVSLPDNLMEEEDPIGLITRFAGKASGMDCAAMADGVSTRAALCAAVSAGYAYLAGGAVLADQAELGISRREFNLEQALGA